MEGCHSRSEVEILGERLLTKVSKTQTGKTEKINLKYKYKSEYPAEYDENFDYEQNRFPTMICGLPDGDYMVEKAFHADGKPYFVTVINGNYDDKQMAIAGAHMWWCVESQNPTGDREFNNYTRYSEWYDFHFGPCDELYTVHDNVTTAEFNLDTKVVTLKTRFQF